MEKQIEIERYNAVMQYANNQCPASWEHLVKFVLNTEPLIVRAANSHGVLLDTLKEILDEGQFDADRLRLIIKNAGGL